MPQQVTWQSLVDAAKNGDAQAVTTLYEQSYKTVFCTIRAMVSDEDTALDLTQDTFVKIFSSLDKLGDPNKFKTWSKAVGRNLTLNYLRKKKPMMFTDLAPDDADDDYELPFEDTSLSGAPEAVLDQKETSRLIREILATLSDSQRLAVGLYYYEGLSVKEISRQTGMSESSVKVHLHNGRKRIEEKVKALEAKGTKLYSLTPMAFLLWLFHTETKHFNRIADPAARTLLSRLAETGKVSVQAGQTDASGKAARSADSITNSRTPKGTGESADAAGETGESADSITNSHTPKGTGNTADASGKAARSAENGMTTRTARGTGDAGNGIGNAAPAAPAQALGSAAAAGTAAGAKTAAGSVAAKVLAGIAALAIAAGAGALAMNAVLSRNTGAEDTGTSDIAEADGDSSDALLSDSGDNTGPELVTVEDEQGQTSKHAAPTPARCVEATSDSFTTAIYDANGNVVFETTENGASAYVYTYAEDGTAICCAMKYTGDSTYLLSYEYNEDGLPSYCCDTLVKGSGNEAHESVWTYTMRDDGQPAQTVETQYWSWGAIVVKTTDYTYNEAGDCIEAVITCSGEYDVEKEVFTYEVNETGERIGGTHEVTYREGGVVTTTLEYTYGDTEATLNMEDVRDVLCSGVWAYYEEWTHYYNLVSGETLILSTAQQWHGFTFTFSEDGTCLCTGTYTMNGAESTETLTTSYTLSGNAVSMTFGGETITLVVIWDGTQWLLTSVATSAVMTLEQ